MRFFSPTPGICPAPAGRPLRCQGSEMSDQAPVLNHTGPVVTWPWRVVSPATELRGGAGDEGRGREAIPLHARRPPSPLPEGPLPSPHPSPRLQSRPPALEGLVQAPLPAGSASLSPALSLDANCRNQPGVTWVRGIYRKILRGRPGQEDPGSR